MELRIYKTKEEVALNFSDYFHKFVSERSIAHIALSGGSTPKIVFEELAAHYKDRISWKNVHLYWGDERCVPADDAESNYKMTRDFLLSKIDIPENNIHRIKGEHEPESEARAYGLLLEENLPAANGTPQFDLVILGMGDDGHAASIFPHQIDLWYAPDHCVVAQHPETGQQRVSITGSIINQATDVAFLVTGGGKASKVEEIISQTGNYTEYPASLVAPASGNLIWFLDEAAASKM